MVLNLGPELPMETAKAADIYGSLPGHTIEQCDASQAYIQADLANGIPTYIRIPREFWPRGKGWGHAWMMAIVAGTTICCRKIIAEDIYPLISQHKVTHFGGAPIVLSSPP